VLSALHAFKNCRSLIFSVLRNQHRDWLANRFVCRIAVDALRTLVPTCDDTIKVVGDDCIVGGLDDGCKEIRKLVAAATCQRSKNAANVWG
jgi:hypothetical protein